VTKGEAWQKWWKENHGNNMPMGSYHPMEGHMYEAFEAGWDIAAIKSQAEILHLKEQLLRVGNQEKLVKEAYLTGQMAAAKEKDNG
jgi:hypothetical protein